ncbi:hypothetical protein SAY87_027601 [Trapa incisa]|uniref:Amino acid transporter transmembrane domain-containing protein n=1 Tax=Trapa incisa TaxID=236973 RepID=A0AAN7PIA4_9MYRT|nr:hypothetical protein SAY87_027601 [Trapa incisa]
MSRAARMHVPLLPSSAANAVPDVDDGRRASVSGAVFNVSTSIIGAGIMSIPATLKVLGVAPAFVLVVAIAWLANVSVEFLLRFTSAGQSVTYAGVMRESFGPVGSVAVQLSVLVANLGCLIVYLIIMGDVLSGNKPGDGSIHMGVLQEWFGFYWWNSREFSLLFTAIFVLLPLVLLRRVESLKFSSAVSVLMALVFVGISSLLAIAALVKGKTQNPRWLPELDNKAAFFDLFTAIPVIVTAFTFHFNVHPISFELGKPSYMMSAVRVSLLLCAAIYFAIGIFGYLLFGDLIMPDILVNFNRTSDSGGGILGSILNDAVRLSYALHLMLVFPLLNFSLRSNVDEFFFSNKRHPPLVADSRRFIALTVALLVISYVAAIAFPNIWYFFQFVGSTSGVCLAFIFPGAIVLRSHQFPFL